MFKVTATSAIALAAAQVTLFAPAANALSASQEGAWDLIRAVDIEEVVSDTSYEVRKTFPDAVAEGITQFNLTGFVKLTYTDENVEEFILVSDMGFCPYCGDPDHGASLQIKLSQPEATMIDGDRITVLGNLTPIRDSQTWQSLVLQDALVLK